MNTFIPQKIVKPVKVKAINLEMVKSQIKSNEKLFNEISLRN